MKKQIPFRIIPLGGLGEVGRNMMVYQYGEEYLIVDAGLMFPDNDMPGVDYIIPDIQFLLDKRSKVLGIIITHGHEDHLGAIHHLLEEVQAPLYATPLTRGLLEVKLGRNGILAKTTIHTVQAGEVVQIGPFRVEFFHVCHSIPDGVGIGIQTPAGLIVHSGDYKFDHTPVDNWPSDYAKLAEFSKRGVLALLADSTNAENPGWTPSERVIDTAFNKVFSEAKGRIIVASFASLISRMQQVANAAQNHGRRLAFAGASMIDNSKIAKKLGYLDIPDATMVTLDQALKMPDEEVVIMCTGSQGEPSSILGRLSVGNHHLINVERGDTIILSSRAIPGNEEVVYRTINRLIQLGANVVYEAIAQVHVSGHASQEEIKLLINLVRPKYVIPIHGELRHLKQHARIAQSLGIPEENIAVVEDGQVIEFLDGKMRMAERVATSRIFVDGSGVGDVDHDVMKERESLSQGGILLIHARVDRYTHALIDAPQIITHGFITESEYSILEEQMKRIITETIIKANGSVNEDVKKAVRTYVYNETHRKPMIFVNISEF